jgi:hypothetical protein
MTTWLHFIGRKYYATAAKFTREARVYGITRRVSLATLRRMAWGDRVLLAQQSGASVVVFGQFTLTKLSGFSAAAGLVVANAYADKVEVREYPKPRRVERGCGSYTVVGEMSIRETPLVAIVDTLRKVKDPGLLMVGGTFAPLFGEVVVDGASYLTVSRVRLKSVPFAQGFRPFAYDEFKSEVVGAKAARPGKPVAVTGLFYAVTDHEAKVRDGIAELVQQYERGTGYRQGDLEL